MQIEARASHMFRKDHHLYLSITIFYMETTTSFCLFGLGSEPDTALDISWKVFFEELSDDMNGAFPRVNEWTRFANKIEKDGINWWFERNAKYFNGIKKVEKIWYGDKYKITFVNPLPIIFGMVGTEQVIKNANGLNVTVSYDWYWNKNWRQDKIANGIQIHFENVTAF